MILEKVITLIAEQFSIEENQLGEDTSFEEIGADEVDLEELIDAVEDEFEVELASDEKTELTCIADLVKAVQTAINLIDEDE